MLKCADERNVCVTKVYKVYGKMYQNHVDKSYAVELVVGRHPEFPGSTGGKPPEYKKKSPKIHYAIGRHSMRNELRRKFSCSHLVSPLIILFHICTISGVVC